MINYDYIINAINSLNNLEGVDNSIIGYSELGQPIYAYHVGPYDAHQIIVEASIHAREWITSLLLVEMVKYYATQDLEFGIYFIPLTNPDGVRLALDGPVGIPQEFKDFVLQINGGSENFSLWKANIRAVDLNVNFDADWGGGSQNVRYPNYANFIGYAPNSESEVKALIDFTNQVDPFLTLSYHSKGEVIYYGFTGLTPEQLSRDLYIAEAISGVTGYEVIRTQNSTGGYSDYVSRHFEVPAFTIEVGNYLIPHPIGVEYLNTIYEQNKLVPLTAYNSYMEYLSVNPNS